MSDKTPVPIGVREEWGQLCPFGISAEDLRQHLYVVGKSGTGKTTLLLNLIGELVDRGYGVGVIDPHGDLATDVLDRIPRRRIEETVYFNPADVDFPIGFNVLKSSAPQHLVASGIVSALKGIWSKSWGPRMEYILYGAVAALLDCENVSLLGLQRMLSDPGYRYWVVKQVKDPMVRSFWEDEFAAYEKRFLQEAIAPIQNKVGQLLMSPITRNILGQVRSTIDARYMMDDGRVFVANLAKGRLGEDKSNLLGALLVTQFQLAAMSRADSKDRRQFFLFVDEFQSFTSEAFASVLSEARKYGLSLILSHQYLGQIPEEMRRAVFGNVGSLVSFRVGQTDAEVLKEEFGGDFQSHGFGQLPNHQVIVRTIHHGEPAAPFQGETLPPPERQKSHRGTIENRSREKYGTPREVAENRIRRWMGQ